MLIPEILAPIPKARLFMLNDKRLTEAQICEIYIY